MLGRDRDVIGHRCDRLTYLAEVVVHPGREGLDQHPRIVGRVVFERVDRAGLDADRCARACGDVFAFNRKRNLANGSNYNSNYPILEIAWEAFRSGDEPNAP